MSPKPHPSTADRVLTAVAAYCDVPKGVALALDTPLTLGAGSILALESEFSIFITRREAEAITTVGKLIVLVSERVVE